MDRVYLETSFFGHLTSRRSRDPLVAARQEITRTWWDTRRTDFELYISELVWNEAREGDEEAARERLQVLTDLRLLDMNDAVWRLAGELLTEGPFPQVAKEDALHVAVATVHGMDFLLTWNCRHIANAQLAREAAALCSARGYEFPSVCTPELLMGE